MRIGNKKLLVFLAIGCAGIGTAATVSYTGTLANAEDVFTTTATLPSPGTLTLQTWGFGGGTNAALMVIPAGGFDPLVAVFMGTGSSAAFVQGSSDILSNYLPFMGCPPAGTVTIGSVAGNCGDVLMALSLSAGTYTILLSNGAYIPNAVFSGVGTLGDGFTDLTGGAFQTCVDSTDCKNDTANWALDVSVSGSSSPVPEPAAWGIACMGMLGLTIHGITRNRKRGGVQL